VAAFLRGLPQEYFIELAGHGIAFFCHTGIAGGLPDTIIKVAAILLLDIPEMIRMSV
jgi:hypothetical protein